MDDKLDNFNIEKAPTEDFLKLFLTNDGGSWRNSNQKIDWHQTVTEGLVCENV